MKRRRHSDGPSPRCLHLHLLKRLHGLLEAPQNAHEPLKIEDSLAHVEILFGAPGGQQSILDVGGQPTRDPRLFLAWRRKRFQPAKNLRTIRHFEAPLPC
jgi:hypothetical protein